MHFFNYCDLKGKEKEKKSNSIVFSLLFFLIQEGYTFLKFNLSNNCDKIKPYETTICSWLLSTLKLLAAGKLQTHVH